MKHNVVLRASTTPQDNPRSRAVHRIYTVKNDKADSGSQIRISYFEILMVFFFENWKSCSKLFKNYFNLKVQLSLKIVVNFLRLFSIVEIEEKRAHEYLNALQFK